MADFAVETVELGKRFGDVRAVEALDLRVRRGEIYGFLGLNGAGKSTTIRMLLAMIAPSAGTASLLGEPVRPGAGRLWLRVGHLVESAVAYPELTVRENLEVSARLTAVRDARAVSRRIEELALAPYADRRARTLSRGNLQRLALARALLGDPDLLVLDEPANGLDPAGVVEVRELLRSLARDAGVTVFMSSHHLAEVDRLATRIGIVHGGRLVEEMGTAEMEAKRDRRLEVGSRDPDAAAAALEGAGFGPVVRGGQPGGGGRILELRARRAVDAPDEVARALVTAGTAPTRLAVVQEDLEQHFLRLTRDAGGVA